MNIVYKITHTKRLIDNTPPYYYIGSKYCWKGDGTYFGSSTDSRMKYANKEDLLFEILCVCLSNDRNDLLDLEKTIQIDNCVLKDQEYFNKSIAMTNRIINLNIPVTVMGIDFESKAAAMRNLGVTEHTLELLIDGKVKPRTYVKLSKTFQTEFLDKHLTKINVKYAKPISVCGEIFGSYREATEKLGMSEWTFTNFSRGLISETVIKHLVNYFGISKVLEYYVVG